MRVWAFYFCCWLSIFLMPELGHGFIDVRAQLAKIPKDDQQDLETFFRALFKEGFGYTLFGDKPLTIASWHGNPQWIYFFNSQPHLVRIRTGWATWKKYEHLFSNAHYKLYRTHFSQEFSGTIHEVGMINRRACLLTLEQHRCLFNAVFSASEPAEKRLASLEKGQPSFTSQPDLLGILLGYGAKNAQVFAEESQLFGRLIQLPGFPNAAPKSFDEAPVHIQQSITLNMHLEPASTTSPQCRCVHEYSDCLKRYCELQASGQTTSKRFPKSPLCPIAPPHFGIYNNSSETQQLLENYTRDRRVIMEVFKSDQFLELVLDRYCNG